MPPDIARDIRCVAILGVTATPALASDGRRYTAIVGADAMDATGQSREIVRDLILAQVRHVRAERPDEAAVKGCTAQMHARLKARP